MVSTPQSEFFLEGETFFTKNCGYGDKLIDKKENNEVVRNSDIFKCAMVSDQSIKKVGLKSVKRPK